MNAILTVMAGGALGAGARYSVGLFAPWRGGFPWATFTVNLAGGLAMGVLMALVMKGGWSETARLFVGVGVLGGFTTFSAFSFEVMTLLQSGRVPLAAGYALISVVASIAATFIGFGLIK